MPDGQTLRQLLDSYRLVGVAIAVIDAADWRILGANAAFRDLFSYAEDRLPDLLLSDLIPDSTSRQMAAWVEGLTKRRQPHVRRCRDSGGAVFAAAISVVYGDPPDHVVASFCKNGDNGMFSLLYTQMNEAVAIHEMVYDEAGLPVDYRIIDVNPRYTHHTGIPAELARGGLASTVYDLSPPPNLAEFALVADGGGPLVFRQTLPNSKRSYDLKAIPVRPTCFTTIFSDVSDRQRTERNLVRSRGMLEGIADALPVMVYVIDVRESRVVYHNRTPFEQLGVSHRGNLQASPIDQLVGLMDPDSRVQLLTVHRPRFAQLRDGETHTWEWSYTGDDGRCHWAATRTKVFRRDESGQVAQVLGVIENIDERKSVSLGLDRFIDNCFDLVAVSDGQGFLSRVNPAWTRVLGWSAAEMLSIPYRELVHPEDRGKLAAQAAQVSATDLRAGSELRLRCKDGSYRWLLWSAVESGGAYYAIARDITNKVVLNERLQAMEAVLGGGGAPAQAKPDGAEAAPDRAELLAREELERLGEYAAKVAHDMHTPLGLAITTSTFLQERTVKLRGLLGAAGDEPKRAVSPSFLREELDALNEAAALILANVGRALELVGSFKTHAVDQASHRRRRFDLESLLRQTLYSLRPRLEAGRAAVELACPPDLDMDACPSDLSQIVVNLVMNAAIHGFAGLDGGTIAVRVAPSGEDRLLLSVEDDGVGIAPEIQARVFEPFFTTAAQAGGSGLGLSIVADVARRRLGGEVALESRPATPGGRGYTRFSLDLPRVAPA